MSVRLRLVRLSCEARRQTSPLTPTSSVGSSGGMTNLKKIRLIEETIEDLRVYLRKDGGDCELIDVDGSNVLVSLTGACVGCQMASVTVSGIQERLDREVGRADARDTGRAERSLRSSS